MQIHAARAIFHQGSLLLPLIWLQEFASLSWGKVGNRAHHTLGTDKSIEKERSKQAGNSTRINMTSNATQSM
jgi:hypothetical protein